MEWFTSSQAIAKGNNLQQVGPGTTFPTQLMPEEDTYIPRDTRSFTLLSRAEAVKLQLDLLCREWLGFCFPQVMCLGLAHSPKDTALVAGPEPEELQTPLPGCAQPWLLLGSCVGSSSG